jgi:TRAP-type C4-dicarboxylate transport system substrate-binding protein
VVDGAENNEPSFVSTRHFETARTLSLTRHVMAPEVLAMSAHRWERLSGADREAVRAAARESVPVMRQLWEAREREARAELERAGVTVVEDVDFAAFNAAVRPVWQRFLAEPSQRALADAILAVGA